LKKIWLHNIEKLGTFHKVGIRILDRMTEVGVPYCDIDIDAPVTTFEIVEDAPSGEDEVDSDDESLSAYEGVRPTWAKDEAVAKCNHCSTPFTFIRRSKRISHKTSFHSYWRVTMIYYLGHHCRFCGQIFCNDCSKTRVSYPDWFGYNTPQRVCEDCIPILFRVRRAISSPDLSIRRQNSFVTQGKDQIPLSLRFVHPFSKLAFWFSGMYEGGNFDRSYLSSAACLSIPIPQDPIKSIERARVPVPKQWPATKDDDPWHHEPPKQEDLTESIGLVIFTPQNVNPPYPILVRAHFLSISYFVLEFIVITDHLCFFLIGLVSWRWFLFGKC
jgi:hypothetical protein